MSTDPQSFDIEKIMALLPHRYPFLLIDRVDDIIRGETAVGIKNVTINEPFFPGHFPGKPVMPGVLILEAMAQTAAVLALDVLGEETHGKVVYFLGIDKAKFRRAVGPGDTLRMTVTKERGGGSVWRFGAVAMVGEEKAAEATLTAMLSRD